MGRKKSGNGDDRIFHAFKASTDSEKQDLVNRIADQMKSQGIRVTCRCSAELLTQRLNRFERSMYIPEATEHDVRKLILKLNDRKASGCDKIKPLDLKDVVNIICEPIKNIINLSISRGSVPCQLKRSIVRPIHKGGTMSNVANYRPISLLPNIAKIIERYLEERIMKFLEKYNLIDPNQFGYQKKKGTIPLLEQVIDKINTGLDRGLHFLCLFVDFSKAFDSINHSKLIEQLDTVGIRRQIREWMISYLSDRTYTVRVGDYESDQHILERGVPQGSILGSLLYILYVNDVGRCFTQCEYFMYADDTAIVCRHKNLEDAIEIMKREFYVFQQWAHDKQLNINVSKTKIMHIRTPKYATSDAIRMVVHDTNCLHDQISNCQCTDHIELVTNYNYLGIVFDEHMLWTAHVEKLKRQLRCLAFSFYHLRYYVPFSALHTIYRALVESILCYGITIYGQSSRYILHSLQRLQSAIVRHMQYSATREGAEVGHIMNINQLYVMRKILNNFKDIGEWERVDHSHATRANERGVFKVARYNNKYGQRRNEVSLRQIFNKVHPNILTSTRTKTFKENVREWVLANID